MSPIQLDHTSAQILHQQGLSAFCADVVQSDELTARMLHTEAQVILHRRVLRQLAEELERYAGRPVSIVVLKGVSLGRHWPNPLRRPACDIDIYTGEDWRVVEAWAAEHATRDEHHAESADARGKHSAWTWYGVHIENHRRLLDGSPAEEPIERWLLEQQPVRYKNMPLLRLDPAAERVFCLTHMARHFQEYESIQLRHLLDWWYLCNSWPADLTIDLQPLGLHRFAALMTRLTEELTCRTIRPELAPLLRAIPIPDADITRALADIIRCKKKRSAGLWEKPANLYYLLRSRWKFRYVPTRFADRLRMSLGLS